MVGTDIPDSIQPKPPEGIKPEHPKEGKARTSPAKEQKAAAAGKQLLSQQSPPAEHPKTIRKITPPETGWISVREITAEAEFLIKNSPLYFFPQPGEPHFQKALREFQNEALKLMKSYKSAPRLTQEQEETKNDLYEFISDALLKEKIFKGLVREIKDRDSIYRKIARAIDDAEEGLELGYDEYRKIKDDLLNAVNRWIDASSDEKRETYYFELIEFLDDLSKDSEESLNSDESPIPEESLVPEESPLPNFADIEPKEVKKPQPKKIGQEDVSLESPAPKPEADLHTRITSAFKKIKKFPEEK